MKRTTEFWYFIPLKNILSHIKFIPPLGSYFIMQKALIHDGTGRDDPAHFDAFSVYQSNVAL